jgi:hypothetical protein
MNKSAPRVVRVSVNNNFNCTETEYKQLDDLSVEHPSYSFFVNTNIRTPNLLKINDHPYKAVITLNPDIYPDLRQIKRLYSIASEKVAFVRIKYIPGQPKIVDLIKKISKTHTVVITLQRFNGKKTISPFIPDYEKHYKFSHNRYRLFGDSLKVVEDLISDQVSICDKSGLGCGGCGMCSTLTTGELLPIYTLNMSSSGFCMYNCCDCYAKTMQRFLLAFGHSPITFDRIQQNAKQKGVTKHILHAKNNLI